MIEKGQLLSANIWFWLHIDILLTVQNMLKDLTAFKKKIPALTGIMHIYANEK